MAAVRPRLPNAPGLVRCTQGAKTTVRGTGEGGAASIVVNPSTPDFGTWTIEVWADYYGGPSGFVGSFLTLGVAPNGPNLRVVRVAAVVCIPGAKGFHLVVSGPATKIPGVQRTMDAGIFTFEHIGTSAGLTLVQP